MKGEILGFSDAHGGAISGEDGTRYRFHSADWRGSLAPLASERVDFEIVEGRAIDVYPIRPTSQTVASHPVAAATAQNPSSARWTTPMFGIGAAIVVLFYVFLIPPALFHPMGGNFKPLLLIGLSIAAIVWRNKRSFARTNQYGVETYRGFGHLMGSGMVDLVVSFAAIAGMVIGGFALLF